MNSLKMNIITIFIKSLIKEKIKDFLLKYTTLKI